MLRWLILLNCLLVFSARHAAADDRYGPRIRIGRVEFGIPILDAFITVQGDRTTVKVFSRGDIANVHRDSGTRVDVGIRSLFIPRRSLRDSQQGPSPDSAPDAPAADSPEINLRKPQPLDSPPNEKPNVASKNQDPKGRDSRKVQSSKRDVPKSTSPLDKAEDANARGDYRTARTLASAALKNNQNDHRAYSIRATSLIGQGEKQRNMRLIREGLADIHTAIGLGKQNDDEEKRDYLVWFIGMNQLSALNRDRRQAAKDAQLVDDYTTQHVDKFPDELKEQIYHQQGFARLILGKRSKAEESFRQAGKIGAPKAGR